LLSPEYFKTTNKPTSEKLLPLKPLDKLQKSFEVPALRFNPSSGTSLVDWSIGGALSGVLKYRA
jgi:hypothetical protein